jgi:hypothetical protein
MVQETHIGPGGSSRATRLQRPTWRDGRLLGGILLVLLATALGAKAVAAADDRVPRYAASAHLKPGDRLDAATLVAVQVLLDDGMAGYLSAANPLPTGSFALREIRSGELVPLSAVGSRADLDVQPVTVRVDSDSTAGLVAGSVVDVWVSTRDPAANQERYQPATLMLKGVTVAWLPGEQSSFGGGSGNSAVQVLVPTDEVPKVITAQDDKARFTLVPVPGSARSHP